MKLPRFTIRSLLALVSFVAVALAALRASTDAWDGGVLGLTLLSLLTAVLLAVHRTDRKRAFWLGFALFGWAYLVLSLIPPVESRLPTTRGLAYLDTKLSGRERTVTVIGVTFSPDGRTLHKSTQGKMRVWDSVSGPLLVGQGGTAEDFVRIGHSLLTSVLAFAGGWLSRRLYDSGKAGRVVGSEVVEDSTSRENGT